MVRVYTDCLCESYMFGSYKATCDVKYDEYGMIAACQVLLAAERGNY